MVLAQVSIWTLKLDKKFKIKESNKKSNKYFSLECFSEFFRIIFSKDSLKFRDTKIDSQILSLMFFFLKTHFKIWDLVKFETNRTISPQLP